MEYLALMTQQFDDLTSYRELFSKVSSQFQQTFYNNTSGSYLQGLQTETVFLFSVVYSLLFFWFTQVMALYLNFDNSAIVEGLIIHLLNDILSTNKGHLSTGILGTKYLFEILRIEASLY